MNKKENILVVDDTHDSLSVLCKLLEVEGYVPFPADSGELALASLNNNTPALILLDIRMPEMNGFEVCKRIKQNKKFADIPIIFLTAATEIDDKLNGLRLGAVDYITKPFHKEELLTRLNTHLKLNHYNQLFREQTAEKLIEANKELILAKKKAEESDKLKTEFINNMSHEIRTPMNGILGFTSFLEKPNITDSKRKQYISIIKSSGNQLMRIIDDILEISKLGTKQVKTIENKICLNDLLLEHFSIFDIKAKENKIPLYLQKGLSKGESQIFTDETKINKILSNLLENALKFTHSGYVEFGYNLVETHGSASLQIYVKDTGIGIKAENQKIIFDRFSQEEKSLSRNVGGLGLGLSIAKENAELLGGKITLKSEKGKGSTFFVTIPYKPVNLELNIKKQTTMEKKYTFLIVEDEEINYLYIDTLLEDSELNIKTLHAKNGKKAIEICQENSEIDFVFMDLKMPIMSGFEATKLIKEFRPNLPIIAQTAYSTKSYKDQALLAGCDDFISKPISEETLNDTIRKHLIN